MLEDRVKEIIVEQLGVNAEQVTPEASFIDDLGADSLDTVELIMAFEEEFGAEIPDEDAEKLKSVIHKELPPLNYCGFIIRRRRSEINRKTLVEPAFAR